MHNTNLTESDARTWTFEVDGFHLDGPQQAKSIVADQNGVRYQDLRAKVVNPSGIGGKYVVVVEAL